MYTEKIQVSRDIPWYTTRNRQTGWCSTCLNGRITEDVRKIKFDFPGGYHRRFFAELVEFPNIFVHALTTVSYASAELDLPK